MVETVFSFGTDQFNRIFPFYMLIDNQLRISSLGRSVAKLYALKEGALFTDHFKLKLPNLANVSFGSLKEFTDQVVLISFRGANENILRGQFEYLEAEDQVLFIGTPRFSS